MALTSIATVATGDTIQAAWANDLRDNFLVLDARTGGDPGAANLALISNGVGSAVWMLIPSGAIANGAVLDTKTTTPKVNRTGDSMSGNLAFTNSNQGPSFYGGGRITDVNAIATVIRAHMNRFLVTNIAENVVYLDCNAGNLNVSSLNVGAINASGVSSTGFSGPGSVPSGAVVWFELLAELTAAGASWARYTAADGLLLVGAGTTYGQTWVQATNYGTAWEITQTVTGSGGGGTTASSTGTGGTGTGGTGTGTAGGSISGSASGPNNTGSANSATGPGTIGVTKDDATLTVSGSASVSVPSLTIPSLSVPSLSIPSLAVTVGISGNTVSVPRYSPMRAGIWGRKN